MIPVNPEALKPFASKYVWWKTPDEAVAMPERVIAPVMTRCARSLNTRKPGSSMSAPGLTGITASAWPAWIAFRPCLCGGLRERCLQTRKGIMPPAQQRLWPALRPAADLGFVLYGGTAVALRLGHRASVDFDFFSERPLDRDAIRAAFPFVEQSALLQDKGNTWSLLAPYGDSERQQVKVSFFGALDFGRVGEPDFTDDWVLQVASFDDLMATKVKVILQRAEAKDYRDVAAMVSAGVSLSHGLAAARRIFGPNFQPSESLKALVYFGDGDLNTLTAREKNILVHAVQAVRDLPEVTIISKN